jgi:aldose 1-epimerase
MPDGRPVERLELGGPPGPVLHVLTLGATVHRLEVTGGDGRRRNVVLGHPTPADYLAGTDYLGGTIGRYANRIAGGRFPLDGRVVEVATHDRGNSLHGGPDGFDRRLWEVVERGPRHAVLHLDSPHGDQGFPGNLGVDVRFDVYADVVRIDFTTRTDRPTVVNLTNHAYFNLDGEGSGVVDDHLLTVVAGAFTPVDGTGIPLGEVWPVDGTPFDFRKPTPIGRQLRSHDAQLALGRGIDHNYAVAGTGLRRAAVLESVRTGTRMELLTDQPGLQVYTGNFLDGSTPGLSGPYRQGDGIALEPQRFPDSPNRPRWASPVLRPGETYRAAMEWRFAAATSGA